MFLYAFLAHCGLRIETVTRMHLADWEELHRLRGWLEFPVRPGRAPECQCRRSCRIDGKPGYILPLRANEGIVLPRGTADWELRAGPGWPRRRCRLRRRTRFWQ